MPPRMSALDRVLAANERYSARFAAGQLPAAPRLKLAVLTCMDARLDVNRALGLAEGDAHVIRNAGGLTTDDAIRSLTISQRVLETREIALVRHTRCGMLGLDGERFVAEIEQDAGSRPAWNPGGFADLEEDLRSALQELRTCPFLPRRDAIRAFVYEVESGRLRAVEP
jgi:carbonic anhydrase